MKVKLSPRILLLGSILVILPVLIACHNDKATTSTVAEETVEQEEARIKVWLEHLDKELVQRMYEDSEASWNYEANLTDHNYESMNNLSVTSAKYYKVSRKQRKLCNLFFVVGYYLNENGYSE